MLNEGPTEKFFVENDLLRRCKLTIEVIYNQELHEEIEHQKNLRKETEYKNKINENQLGELEIYINFLKQEFDVLKSENYKIHDQLIESNKVLAKYNNLVKENQELKEEACFFKAKVIELQEKNKQENSQDIEKYQKTLKELEDECNRLTNELKTFQEKILENAAFKEKFNELKQNYEKDIRDLKKKIMQRVKASMKKKYQSKEEKLKNEINNTIEDIQVTLKNNTLEHSKLKKENLKLSEKIKNLENEFLESQEIKSEIEKKNLDYQARLNSLEQEINQLKSFNSKEIEKFSTLLKQAENEKIDLNNVVLSLNKKIAEKNRQMNEKSMQVNYLSKEISELEKKNAEKFNEFLENEKKFHLSLSKCQENYSLEISKLKQSLQELNDDIQIKENLIRDLSHQLSNKSHEFEQIYQEKKALEQSISELEISLKHIDIQQTRQSLEELSILREKLSQENEYKIIAESRIEELQNEKEHLSKQLNQDSQFFKMEAARKDTDLFKLKNFLESKLKEKDADYAMKFEEIRTELVGVLGDLLSNDINLDCCEILEQLIQNLSN